MKETKHERWPYPLQSDLALAHKVPWERHQSLATAQYSSSSCNLLPWLYWAWIPAWSMEQMFNLVIVESPFLFQTYVWMWMADMDANSQPAAVLISRPTVTCRLQGRYFCCLGVKICGALAWLRNCEVLAVVTPEVCHITWTWPSLLFPILRNVIFLPLKPCAPPSLSAWLSSKLLLRTVNQAKRRKDGERYKQLFVCMRKWKAGTKSQRVH